MIKSPILKFQYEDNGNCRVYFKRGRAVYCIQDDGSAGMHVYRCSTDGEPSHPIQPTGLEFQKFKPYYRIGRDVLKFIEEL